MIPNTPPRRIPPRMANLNNTLAGNGEEIGISAFIGSKFYGLFLQRIALN
jgi:hypothetical protein